jgi:hypothetical protein
MTTPTETPKPPQDIPSDRDRGTKLGKLLGGIKHYFSVTFGTSTEVTSSTTYTANPYQGYAAKVDELTKKFEGDADWGSGFIQIIIAIRSAFAMGQGIKPTLANPEVGKRELKYIETFLERNKLSEGGALSLADEAEIEGKILLRLFPDKEHSQIDVRAVPWSKTRYTVYTKEGDYANVERVEYTVDSKEVILKDPDTFVYSTFGGRVHKVNHPTPLVSKVLWSAEAMDKALWDWRQVNKIGGLPTPYFKCVDQGEVDDIYDSLNTREWQIGDLLVTTADYSIVGVDISKVETIRQEIVTHAKFISGITGVPVHFLGLPDLMSNRATADNLLSLVGLATGEARKTWRGVYKELFLKVLKMANEEYSAGFNVNAVDVEIPQTPEAKLQEIEVVWLPLFNAGALSLSTLLSKVPEIDSVAETARVEKQQRDQAIEMLDQIKASQQTGGQANAKPAPVKQVV